jgi:phage shock protein E
MKKFLFIGLILSVVNCSPAGKESTFGLLAPKEFEMQLKADPNIILMDVRTPEEMQAGFIEGAKNLDFNSPGFQSGLDSLDHSKTYFVYCGIGKRSGKAAAIMMEKGFQHVTSMEGGLTAWKAAGLPVQTP